MTDIAGNFHCCDDCAGVIANGDTSGIKDYRNWVAGVEATSGGGGTVPRKVLGRSSNGSPSPAAKHTYACGHSTKQMCGTPSPFTR